MIETLEQINRLIDEELSRFQIVETAFLLPYLVTPSLQSLGWDYSTAPISYPAWFVADFQQNDIGIFYSEHGHGTHDHWGVVRISDKQFGTDDHWFATLEDAVIQSGGWNGKLPERYEVR